MDSVCAIGVSRISERLYLGGTSAISGVSELREAGITHILKLYWDEPTWPDDFVVCDLAVDDGVFLEKETVDRGTDFIREAIAAGHGVLVVCGLGISRSTTLVLAYLLEQGYSLKEAYHLIRLARPHVWPARALWTTLITHYNAPYTLDEIERWREAQSESDMAHE